VHRRISSIRILTAVAFLLLAISTAIPQDLKIVKEKRTFYVLFPDSSKVKIVKDQGCGARDVAVLSPDSKYVFYTDCTGIGFESSGKDLFYCKPDGTERTFLHKTYGSVSNIAWVNRDRHLYLLFYELYAGEVEGFVDVYDFENRRMILRIEARGLQRIGDTECFEIEKELKRPPVHSTICLDSLLALSNPDEYELRVYHGYGFPNVLYLSIRREPFLNPDVYWDQIPEYAEIYYGGLGQCFPSRWKRRTVHCVNMDSKSWVGVLNNKTNVFQFSDSMTVGEYKYNFAWSDCDRFLAFVKNLPDNYQEIVVLEFLGDTSYVVKEEVKLKEEREVELVGWSIRKGGFEYMLGKKEFLKIHE